MRSRWRRCPACATSTCSPSMSRAPACPSSCVSRASRPHCPRRRPLRVPDRPGGTHQRAHARGRRAGPRRRALWHARPRARDHRQRARRRASRGRGRSWPWARRHARARRALRRPRRERRPARRGLRGARHAAAGDRDVTAVRVLLADDQRLVRHGLRMILRAEPDIDVVGEAGDGQEAIDQTRRLRPDVVLMDVRMPRLNGIEATRRIVSGPEPRPHVLVLTTFDLDDYVYDALRAGASGFLLKDAPEDHLVSSIRVVAEGGSLLDPAVTRRLIEQFVMHRPAGPTAGLDELTARETEVLTQLARGLSNTEIAAELVVSDATIKTHVARILSKLGLRDRTQAVVFAYESGLVRPTGHRRP